MASAMKCDRCGSYYDKNNTCRMVYGNRVTGICLLTHSSYKAQNFDLCDECIEDLYIFLNVVSEDK